MHTLEAGFEYLSPPVEVNFIQHDSAYIKTGFRETAERRIFYGVPLEDFEISKIRDTENALARRGIPLPPGWNDRETLRYIYGAKFNEDAAINKILECLQWRGSHNRNMIPESSMRLLESGAIYTYGRDPQYRPVVIVDLGKISTDHLDVESVQVALITLLDILKEYCFVPGKVENWIVILDTRGKDLNRLPTHDLRSIFSLLNACYPVTLERLLVINTSPSLFSSWYQVETLLNLDTTKKINLLDSKQMSNIQKVVPSNQLESKFNGSLPDLTKFWIPRVPMNTFTSTTTHDKLHLTSSYDLSHEKVKKSALPTTDYHHTTTFSHHSPHHLDQSLTKLSQHIDQVEGRFNKILSSDTHTKKYNDITLPGNTDYLAERPHSTLPYASSQYTSTYTEEPKRYSTGHYTSSYFPSSTTTAHDKLHLTSSYDLPHEKVKKSALPTTDYHHTTTTIHTTDLHRIPELHSATDTTQVKRKAYEGDQEDLPPGARNTFDFNDRELLDLIMSENSYLRTSNPHGIEKDGHSAIHEDPLNVQDLLKSYDRASTGTKIKTFGDYTSGAERSTQIPDSIITKHTTLISGESVKKSSQYHNDLYLSQPHPRFGAGTTDYELPKSSLPIGGYEPKSHTTLTTSHRGDKHLEDWQYEKYMQRPIEDEEEEDDESNFCGICVSKRKKPSGRTNTY